MNRNLRKMEQNHVTFKRCGDCLQHEIWSRVTNSLKEKGKTCKGRNKIKSAIKVMRHPSMFQLV